MILLFALLQATGVKVGDVTDTSALVWVRSTAAGTRAADGACPGRPARLRVRYGDRATEEAETTAARDFAHTFVLKDLAPATEVEYVVEIDGTPSTAGRFRTAPKADVDAAVTFAVMTCQAYRSQDDPRGFRLYDSMAALAPSFYVAAGDLVYFDNDPPLASTVDLARFHWQRMYSLPSIVDFHRKVPGVFMNDDHDVLWDDAWPSKPAPKMQFGFAEGRRIFREQLPVPERLYRTVRWGRHLQVWFPEGRDFRTPNNAPDGPEKTIWGAEQKAWLKKTLLESDATWKVLVSPTPMVGPDRPGKADNHANAAFAHEGREMRRWFAEHLPKNFIVVCGDRHWQYHSVDPETGVREFSCGPVSDKHAGGTPGKKPDYHKFHRVKGGFLSVEASGAGLAVRHHDVAGAVVHEWRR